jgi:hypothetical protein
MFFIVFTVGITIVFLTFFVAHYGTIKPFNEVFNEIERRDKIKMKKK